MMEGEDEPDKEDVAAMKEKWGKMSKEEKAEAKKAVKGKMKKMAEEEKGGPLDMDEQDDLDKACDELDKDFEGAMKKMKKAKKGKKGKGKKGGKKGEKKGGKGKKLVLDMEKGMDKMMEGEDEPDKEDLAAMKEKWGKMSKEEKAEAKKAVKGKLQKMAEEEKGGPLDMDEQDDLDKACDELDKDFEGAMKKMKKAKKGKKGKGKKGGK